jgi:hypothetical protein
MPRELAIVADPLLLFVIRGFCDIHIHAIFRTDVVLVPLLIEQAQKVCFLFVGVSVVSLT